MKRAKPVAAELPEPRIDDNEGSRESISGEQRLSWETFFSCQRSPVYRSQLIVSLMAGVQLVVEKLPNGMLLDVLLVATASREKHDAEIVDDYQALLERIEEAWRKPDWTCRVFDSIHCMWANCILQGRGKEFDDHDVQYIPELVGWYLAQDSVPDYFETELDDKSFTKYLKAKKAA